MVRSVLMRFRLASLSLLVVTGCVDVEFATGGSGGAGTTTSTGPGTGGSTGSTSGSGGASVTTGSGGATSTTGTGGDATTTTTTSTTTGGGGDCTNKRCGPDGNGGLCNGVAMQDTWSVTLPGEALMVVPWTATQSVFVSTANNHVLRIDQCDGSVMEDQTTVSAFGQRPYLFGLGFDGASELTAIGANASLDNPDRRYFLNATTLVVSGNDTLQNEFGSSAGGAFADASGIWVNLNEGGQGFVPYGGAAECSQKYAGYGTLEARGLTKTATGLYALKWDGNTGRTTIVASLGACASTCTCAAPIDVETAIGTIDNDVVDIGGGSLVAVGANVQTDAHYARFNGTTLQSQASLDYDLTMSGQDVLLTAVTSGGYVYAGGATGLAAAESYDRSPTGTAVLTRVPTGFTASTVPDQYSFTAGSRVRDVAADANGIYAGGLRNAGVNGFLAKCTPGLSCAALP